MTVGTAYEATRDYIIISHHAKTTGFRQALRDVAILRGGDDEPDADYLFREYFGHACVFPAAYRVDDTDTPERPWKTVHVWEIAMRAPISEEKLRHWGWMADGDGAIFNLHIVTSYGSEVIVPNDILECLWSVRDPRAVLAEYLLEAYGRAPAGLIPARKSSAGKRLTEAEKQKAAHLALKELGII